MFLILNPFVLNIYKLFINDIISCQQGMLQHPWPIAVRRRLVSVLKELFVLWRTPVMQHWHNVQSFFSFPFFLAVHVAAEKSTAMSIWSHRWAALMDSAQLCIQFCDKVRGRQRKRYPCYFLDFKCRNYQRSFEQKTDLTPLAVVCSSTAVKRVWLTYCCHLFLAAPFIPLKTQTNASALTWQHLSKGC